MTLGWTFPSRSRSEMGLSAHIITTFQLAILSQNVHSRDSFPGPIGIPMLLFFQHDFNESVAFAFAILSRWEMPCDAWLKSHNLDALIE